MIFLRMPKLLLKHVGLLPDKSIYRAGVCDILYNIFIAATILPVLLSCIAYLVTNAEKNNITDITDAIYTITGLTTVIITYSIFTYYKIVLRDLINSMEDMVNLSMGHFPLLF